MNINYSIRLLTFCFVWLFAIGSTKAEAVMESLPSRTEVVTIMNHVNKTWQQRNPRHGNHFWNRAVYHVGNMAAYDVAKEQQYLDYSTAWAEHNYWWGATSNDTTEWSSSYGEGGKYVLFGDNQICFQIYADLYNYDPNHDARKIERALGVMNYEINTDYNEYIWWVDGMFMVMPTMVKLYNITGNKQYLEKMHDYWLYAHQLMYDSDENLYYRDSKYIYPKHTTINGLKDFWARGDGWAFATFARILDEMPADAPYTDEYTKYFRLMAKALKDCQQKDGYWTRSLLDPTHAPGRETSGTALNAYAYATGIRLGIISEADYGETLQKAWQYLSHIAYQTNGTVGYIQPIGEKADPNQTLSASSYYDFGVGAFLMAASAVSKIAPDTPYTEPLRITGASINNSHEIAIEFNVEPNNSEAKNAANYAFDGTAIAATDISVYNNLAIISLADSIDYGIHTIEVKGIRTAQGGELVGEQTFKTIRTVDLDKPQTNFLVTAIGSQEGNPYTNVGDGDLNTRWSQEGWGQWICFDMTEAKDVYAVDMAFYNGDKRQFYFNIETSVDSISWQTVAENMVSSGMTTEMERFAFTPVEARFVRIVCNGNSQNYWNSPTEIRIRYSSPTSIENLSRPVYSSSSAAYDLQGRSLNNCKNEAKHGIVIINGKKIIVRK